MADHSGSAMSWQQTLRAFLHPRVLTMLFFGFSAGIPILLIFSSLGLWLREAGVDRASVTFFSWAALGYSFKFVWAPLIDRLPVPGLTRRLGRRRAWILLAQLGIIGAILWMASTDPLDPGQLTRMALAAVLLGFSSATQDIVIDAYRIESAGSELQALMSSAYIAGYRIGMLVAGAGALFLASWFGSELGSYSYQAWAWTYSLMAATLLVGLATTLIIDEPEVNRSLETQRDTRDYLGFVALFAIALAGFILGFVYSADVAASAKAALASALGNRHLAEFLVELLRLGLALLLAVLLARLCILAGLVKRQMVQETYIEPIRDFFARYGLGLAWLLLALVGLYRISDIVLGVISNVFFQDLGFTKTEIASVVKTFGLFMTLFGGFLGGFLAMRFGVMRILFLGALLTVLTNLLYLLLASAGNDLFILYFVISADNLTAGLASAAFIAFLSSLTNVSFTAVQYAIFSSLMTLLPKIIGGYSGTMVDSLGYSNFFIIASLMGVPVLLLVKLAQKRFNLAQEDRA
ncbi:AmpG family muropeptide MFS transporter [Magnetovirga frankeli]|uniref:AmpG family muropeptide MFS transporter n=1 Tax=Magnetovirga frankeli TaxID=947516 RepID=UPI003D33184E